MLFFIIFFTFYLMLFLFVPTGYILSLVLLTLPRQHLVKLYLYVLTALLLFAGHQVSRYTHPCYVTLLNALIDTECLLWCHYLFQILSDIQNSYEPYCQL